LSPLVSPFSTTGLPDPLFVTGVTAPASGEAQVTVNELTAKPLSLPGVNETETEPLPLRAAVAPVGASGTVPGKTAFDAADGALDPTAL
jgi:hypothetical protein